MKRFLRMAASAAFVLLLSACARHKIIPDDTLAQIFHDAFLTNAYIGSEGVKTDSLRIYEPIFARYGGDVAVGAMTVITSVSQLCTMPIQGICQGGQPVMSFNFGAGKKPRVKEAFRFQLTLCGCYTCLFWLLMMLAPGAVAGIFTSDTALIDYTTWSMRIYMAGIFAMGFQIACQQSFMALGQAKVSLLLACLRKIILLIPLIFILPHLLPNPVFGVFLAEPVSDILAATITTITFFSRFNGILERGAAKV